MTQETMNIRFVGRTSGAIGITYWITVEMPRMPDNEAILHIYKTHEHCSRFHEVQPDGSRRNLINTL